MMDHPISQESSALTKAGLREPFARIAPGGHFRAPFQSVRLHGILAGACRIVNFAIGFSLTLVLLGTGATTAASPLELKNGVVVSPPNLSGLEKKAITMLLEE